MRRLALLLCLSSGLLCAAGPIGNLSAAGAGHGTAQQLLMPAPSLGDPHRVVRVYLPPSYFTPEAAHRRYPVVYMLHGWPGGENNWLALGKAAETADFLIHALGGTPESTRVEWADGWTQTRAFSQGRFLVLGFAGTEGTDHLNHLRRTRRPGRCSRRPRSGPSPTRGTGRSSVSRMAAAPRST